MHLLLMGLRGSGKTTLGHLASESLSRAFIDLDDRTSLLCGMDATTCFAEQGEEAWRAAEAAALETVLEEAPAVIALGGGSPTAPGAEEMIRRAREDGRARVLWLDAADEVLLARAGSDPARPALTALSGAAEIATIRALRDPIFARLADARADTAESDLDELLVSVQKLLD
ncbi:MAG: hypothetical protein MK085_05485 [Phycisphaerales bacterium]|nr:hypothetical protein [Phycisphaerales bacterium]